MTVDDEAPGGAVVAPLRGRVAIILGLVLALALLGGATWWLTRAEPGQTASVAIALEPAEFVLGQNAVRDVSLTVTNTSGHKLTDATVRVTAADPGGDLPPVRFSDVMFDPECGIEEPGPHPDCVSAEKRAKRQSCAPTKATVTCDGDLAEGTETYHLKFSIGDYPEYEELAALADYPDLKLRARVLVGGESVETATQQLSVEMPEGYGRVDIADLPTDLALTDPPSRRHEWSFTVRNDTGAAVEDAHVKLDMNITAEMVAAGTEHPGCAERQGFHDAPVEFECSGVDIPAGETLTIRMWLNIAEGAAARLDESCPPGSPTDRRCRDDASEGNVLVEVSSKGYFAYARNSLPVRVRD